LFYLEVSRGFNNSTFDTLFEKINFIKNIYVSKLDTDSHLFFIPFKRNVNSNNSYFWKSPISKKRNSNVL